MTVRRWPVLLLLALASAVSAVPPLAEALPGWSRQPVLSVPPAAKAPKIDGYVDYQEWLHAACTIGFVDVASGAAPVYPVRCYLTYDAQNLYVGLVVNRPPLHPTPRATFEPGPQQGLWWKDDNVELVMEPAGGQYGYAFVGNSVGAWSNLRYPLGSTTGGEASWAGQWEYKASRPGLDSWHAELRVPLAQFEGATPLGPGVEWKLAVMNQQLTPEKRMIDWTWMWSFGQQHYASTNKARLRFADTEAPIVRQSELGRLRTVDRDKQQGIERMGIRVLVPNPGTKPARLRWRAELYGTPRKRPNGVMGLFDLWDRWLAVKASGQPLADPNDPTQAFRSADDLLKELATRYQPIDSTDLAVTVPPGQTGYCPLQPPVQKGEFVLAWKLTGEGDQVLASQVVPFQVLPNLDLTLRPYFLTHAKVRAEAGVRGLAKPGAKVRLTLNVAGRALDTREVPVAPEAESVAAYLDTQAWPEGAKGTVTAELVGADGTVAERNETSLTRPPTPAWFGRKLGCSAVVPPPFEPVKVTAPRTMSVWQRTVRLGANGLPESIIARGDELLARPITLEGVAAPAACRPVGADDRDAVFAADGPALAVRTDMHYDGCLRFDLAVPPGKLDELVLDIPLAERYATLFTHAATGTDFATMSTDGLGGNVSRWLGKYPDGMPFTYAFYLGGHDRGVQWFCESDRGWVNAREDRKLGLRRAPGEVALRVKFIDRPTELTAPLHLTFGLQVTPVKDPAPGLALREAAFGQPGELRQWTEAKYDQAFDACREAGATVVSSYMSDPDHFGTPRPYNDADEAYLKGFAAQAHRHGLKYRPYSGWGVNTNIPEFETFGLEMLKEPLRNAGWGCYWHNPASTFADWWLDGVRRIVAEDGFDGVYLDGTCLPELSANELDGFAWQDAQGHSHGIYPVWQIRDFIERLYVMLHHELRRDGIVDLHDGREPLYFIAGFADQAVSGEYHLQRGKTILEVFDPDEFSAYYATNLHGVARRFIWWNWMKLPITENEMTAMARLHDVNLPLAGGTPLYNMRSVGYGRETQTWIRNRKIREAFDGATFVPYWSQPAAMALPLGPLVSAWVDAPGKRALLIVSNLATQPWSGELRLDPAKLGLDPGTEWVDAMFDQPLGGRADAPLRLSIEPQRYRLLTLGARVPLPANAQLDGTQPKR